MGLDKKQLELGELEVKGNEIKMEEEEVWGEKRDAEEEEEEGGEGRRLLGQSCLKKSFALKSSEARLGCV